MEVQIFGIKKSPDTRKALRFFAERRIKTHFVDLQERAASPGEAARSARSTKCVLTRRSAKKRSALRVSALFLTPKI